jgi:hypothetical protein
MNDQNNFGQTNGGAIEGNTPEDQPTAGDGQQSVQQSQEQPDGLIQKVEGKVEEVLEGAIEKTTEVVDGAIDAVADAAQRALGGKTEGRGLDSSN